MGQPVLLAVDDDESLLGDIERELRDRYARHYRVVCVRTLAVARAHLADFAASGVEVALVLRDIGSQTEATVEANALFLLIGAQPTTDWLPPNIERDAQGFVFTGADVSPRRAPPLDRSPFLLETSMPGVFAAGDVRHGGVKRVASAVGEGSIAIHFLHQHFAAEQRQPRGRSEKRRSTLG